MDEPRAYATAGAFRRALEERLKRISRAEPMDINRLRRQVSFDRLLARLFQVQPAPWALKGGYALELRFKAARSTIDIDLTVQTVVAATGQSDVSRAVREMLQSAASISLGDWFEYRIGSAVMDLDAAPDGGARYPFEARMDGRIFSRFHLDAGTEQRKQPGERPGGYGALGRIRRTRRGAGPKSSAPDLSEERNTCNLIVFAASTI
jgi:hypothetical protein